MLIQCSMKVMIWADFKINQDYIAKNLCENRLKPMLNCRGNCQYMKAMKKEAAKEKACHNTLKDKIELLFIGNHDSLGTKSLAFLAIKHDAFYVMQHYSFSQTSIFQPPIG